MGFIVAQNFNGASPMSPNQGTVFAGLKFTILFICKMETPAWRLYLAKLLITSYLVTI